MRDILAFAFLIGSKREAKTDAAWIEQTWELAGEKKTLIQTRRIYSAPTTAQSLKSPLKAS